MSYWVACVGLARLRHVAQFFIRIIVAAFPFLPYFKFSEYIAERGDISTPNKKTGVLYCASNRGENPTHPSCSKTRDAKCTAQKGIERDNWWGFVFGMLLPTNIGKYANMTCVELLNVVFEFL